MSQQHPFERFLKQAVTGAVLTTALVLPVRLARAQGNGQAQPANAPEYYQPQIPQGVDPASLHVVCSAQGTQGVDAGPYQRGLIRQDCGVEDVSQPAQTRLEDAQHPVPGGPQGVSHKTKAICENVDGITFKKTYKAGEVMAGNCHEDASPKRHFSINLIEGGGYGYGDPYYRGNPFPIYDAGTTYIGGRGWNGGGERNHAYEQGRRDQHHQDEHREFHEHASHENHDHNQAAGGKAAPQAGAGASRPAPNRPANNTGMKHGG